MPPSRDFKVRIDPAVQADLEMHLGIQPYRVQFVRAKTNTLHGQHFVGNKLITIQLGLTLFSNSSLRAVKHEILETLLHEFRHAHQWVTWTPERIAEDKKLPYAKQEMEADANEWSAANVSAWRHLFTIRPVSGNNLGRLAAAAKGR